MRDRVVREDMQGLRSESEAYSQMVARAELNWPHLKNETRAYDQLVENSVRNTRAPCKS